MAEDANNETRGRRRLIKDEGVSEDTRIFLS